MENSYDAKTRTFHVYNTCTVSSLYHDTGHEGEHGKDLIRIHGTAQVIPDRRVLVAVKWDDKEPLPPPVLTDKEKALAELEYAANAGTISATVKGYLTTLVNAKVEAVEAVK